MKIKKASPGLDQRNRLGRVLGDDFDVEDYDPARPLAAQVADADVLLVRDVPITREVIDAAPRLKLIQRPGDHLPAIDLEHARCEGHSGVAVPVAGAGDACARCRRARFLSAARARQAALARAESVQERARTGLPKTVCRARARRSGWSGSATRAKRFAKLAVPFGLRVIAVKRTPDDALARKLGLAWLGTHGAVAGASRGVRLRLAASAADPGDGRSHRCTRAGDRCGKASYLINISRAPMLNRAARCCDALSSGHLGGAGLDVWWEEPADPADPLLAMRNVILTPHIAADTTQTEQRLAELTAENVRRIATRRTTALCRRRRCRRRQVTT